MRAPLFSIVLFGILCTGCVVKVNGGDASNQPAAEGSEAVDRGGPTAVAPIEAETPPPADPHAELPDCPASPGEDMYCTEAGKLAGRWMMVDMLRVPEDAEPIFEAAPADHQRKPSLRIAVSGETLYLAHETCGSCARIMGQGFEGQLDALNEAQLLAVQARLGLEGAPAMGSTQQWRDYAAGEGQAALTELAARSE